ncbi:hypothetical protein SAMN05518672_105328 [Chitinophaga sp. CF118]|uniref:hypothetical protein n=1 Tax=Chitinophaga sp. CF118 TaxID=1884367 RepID=UPI0008EED37C|nr:hypothetical protein [Chitinophaga sp. CF118]SFE33916.1 hypothetical protein SAMN05518672_105328 [Chitinophaga sp. CF118]
MNISVNGGQIKLNIDKVYFVIDVLYCTKIKKNINVLDASNFGKDIKVKLFPDLDTPYAKFLNRNNLFSIEFIQYLDEDIDSSDAALCFATDTGLIVFVEESIFIDFISNSDYDQFVDAATSSKIDYWAMLEAKYTPGDIALVLAAGEDSGYEFSSGGVYKIDV